MVDTDYIPMDDDNFRWLYKMAVLSKRGGITKNSIRMSFREQRKDGGYTDVEKDTFSWSVLCELVESAKGFLSSSDDYGKIQIDMNDILTLLRTQSLEIPYTFEGVEYTSKFTLSDELRNRIGEWNSALASST